MNATDPAAYKTITRNGLPCLVCSDCGRESMPGGLKVQHARNCDLVGARNKLVGPVANAPTAPATCVWRRHGERWLVSGEGVAAGATVVVSRKDGTCSSVQIGGTVEVDGRALGIPLTDLQDAAKRGDLALTGASEDEILELVKVGAISMSDAMNQDF